jgi:hypothetical protein
VAKNGFHLMKARMMWDRFFAGIGIIAAALILAGFRTDALRANWKYAGDMTDEKGGERTLAFFDAENIEYLADGGVKVWVKSVDPSEVEEIVSTDESILKKAGDKAAQSYYPPYFLSNPHPNVSAERYLEMIEWEEAANRANVKTKAKRLYEINCREGKILMISTILYRRDGTTTYASDFDRWSPVSPDSIGEALQRILCR